MGRAGRDLVDRPSDGGGGTDAPGRGPEVGAAERGGTDGAGLDDGVMEDGGIEGGGMVRGAMDLGVIGGGIDLGGVDVGLGVGRGGTVRGGGTDCGGGTDRGCILPGVPGPGSGRGGRAGAGGFGAPASGGFEGGSPAKCHESCANSRRRATNVSRLSLRCQASFEKSPIRSMHCAP